MAQNRRAELEAAQSSSGEGGSSEEGSESEEEEEEEDKTSPPTPPVTKNPSASKSSQTLALPRPSSSEESGSEPESESDSPPEKTRRADPSVKPIASKPMEDPPKSTKKRRSKPSVPSSPTPSKSGAGEKRPAESESKDSKRPKKNVSIAVDVANGAKKNVATGDDQKKQLFQRLWSEDDEIAILKGMMEYTAKKGADPFADMNAFHDFIKKSLHVDVSKNQLSDKVRRLKKKYGNNASKGKKGKDPTFSKPHEQKAYELSKKLWGTGEANSVGGVDEPKVNGIEKKNQNQNNQRASKAAASPKVDRLSPPSVPIVEVDHNVAPSKSVQFDSNSIGDAPFEEEVIRKGLALIPGDKRMELEEKRKKLELQAAAYYLKRVEFIQEQTNAVVEAMKSAGY